MNEKSDNTTILSLKTDTDFNVTQASLIGNLPITATYISNGDILSITNRTLCGLRARGTAKRIVVKGLYAMGYHPCNLHELVEGLYERRNYTAGFSWSPLNPKNVIAPDNTIDFISNQERPKKVMKDLRSTTSIFCLSRSELDRLFLPKDFKYSSGKMEYFIHHCRPDEEVLRDYNLYTNKDLSDSAYLHWKTFLDYFASVHKVPQLERAVYRSISLEQWLDKPVDFATIHLPNEPSKMTPLIATAIFGGEDVLDKLQEILEMKRSRFLEDLLIQTIRYPMESSKERSYQLSIGIQDNGKLGLFSSRPEEWDYSEVSDSHYIPCRQLFSNKKFDLPKIDFKSDSTLLTQEDQLYFKSLFGSEGYKAICQVLSKYEG